MSGPGVLAGKFICQQCGDDEGCKSFGGVICTGCAEEDQLRALDMEREQADWDEATGAAYRGAK